MLCHRPKIITEIHEVEKKIYIAEDGRRFICSEKCEQYELSKYYHNINSQLEFTVKEKHIKLLKNINFEFRDLYRSIELSQEFPFHTDCPTIPSDIVKILGEKDALEYVTKEDGDYYITTLQLHKMIVEVYICLKILLHNCEIKCGLYKKSCSYENDYKYICK